MPPSADSPLRRLPALPPVHLVLCLLLGALIALLGLSGCRTSASRFSATPPPQRLVAASDACFRLSDCVSHAFLPDGSLRFDRVLETPGRGYRWDNPGARIAFRTDARSITVRLRYSDRHTSPSARAPVGLFYVDGATRPDWTFTSRATATLRQPEELELALPVPAAHGLHDYALVLPYGDSVDFLGLRVDAGASFAPPPARPQVRYVAYGDSITHGFTATHVGRTYAYRLAEARGWELVNLGFGGRTARPAEGDFIARQGGHVVSVFVGTNEWQGGIPPQDYAAAVRALLAGLRARQPDVPVVLITPLWVSPAWKPSKARYPLEDYREALRRLVAGAADPHLLLVEGPSLIDHDERFFDPILVHPNDAGFGQMASRLDRALGSWASLPRPR